MSDHSQQGSPTGGAKSFTERVELAGDQLEPKVEQLFASFGQLGQQLAIGDISNGGVVTGHQMPSSRVTMRALIGSFWIARSSAPRATASSG